MLIAIPSVMANESAEQERVHTLVASGRTATISGTTYNSGVTVSGNAKMGSDGTINCASTCTIDGTTYPAISGYRKTGSTFAMDVINAPVGDGGYQGLSGCTSSGGDIICQSAQVLAVFYNGAMVNIRGVTGLRISQSGTISFDSAASGTIGKLSLQGIQGFSFSNDGIVRANFIQNAGYELTNIIGSNDFRFKVNPGIFSVGETDMITIGALDSQGRRTGHFATFDALRRAYFMTNAEGELVDDSEFVGTAKSRDWYHNGAAITLGSDGKYIVGKGTTPPPAAPSPTDAQQPVSTQNVDPEEVDRYVDDLQELYYDSLDATGGAKVDDFLSQLPDDPALLQAIKAKLTDQHELISAIDKKIREIAVANSAPTSNTPTPNPTSTTVEPTPTEPNPAGDEPSPTGDKPIPVDTTPTDFYVEPNPTSGTPNPTEDDPKPPVIPIDSTLPNPGDSPTLTTGRVDNAPGSLATINDQVVFPGNIVEPIEVAFTPSNVGYVLLTAGNPAAYLVADDRFAVIPQLLYDETALIVQEAMLPPETVLPTATYTHNLYPDYAVFRGPFDIETIDRQPFIVSRGINNEVRIVYNGAPGMPIVAEAHFSRNIPVRDDLTAAMVKNIFGNIFKTESGDEEILNDNTVQFNSGPFENLQYIENDLKLTNYFRFKDDFYFPYAIKKISDNIEVNRNGFLKRSNARNTFTMYALDTPSHKLFMKRYNDWMLETDQDFERIANAATYDNSIE